MASAFIRSHASTASLAQPSAGSDTATTSVGAMAATSAPGTASRQYPDPPRSTAVDVSRAAPVMPGDPATTSTAASYLCASRRRRGSRLDTSAGSTTWMRADETSSPMSSTSTAPALAENKSDGFIAANVTVTSACTSSPDGTSTASTSASPGSGGAYVPRKPVP